MHYKNINIKQYNTMRLETYANNFFNVNNVDSLIKAVNRLNECCDKYYLIGAGANVLLPPILNNVIRVTSINRDDIKIVEKQDDDILLDVFAGVSVQSLLQFCVKNELGDCEFMAGIPSTIGGAIVGNMGAHNGCMADIVESVYIYENDKIKKINKVDCEFAYRNSFFKNSSPNKYFNVTACSEKLYQKNIIENVYKSNLNNMSNNFSFSNCDKKVHINNKNNKLHNNVFFNKNINSDKKVILNALIRVKKGKKTEIVTKINENLQKKKSTQPMNKYSAGSVFLRDGDIIPAKIIDELKLKGMSIGGASISEKHSGFIINTGNATQNDVINLIQKIQNVVYCERGIMLKTEVQIIGRYPFI